MDAHQKTTDHQKEKKHRSVWRSIRLVLRCFLLLLLVFVFGAGAWFYARYGSILKEMQQDAIKKVARSNRDTFRQVETSLVYDVDGNVIATLKGEKDVYYISISDIPSGTIKAIISIEDKKFYSHNGLDMRGIVRAGWALVKNQGEITQGASTITQQLARNIFLTHEQTWERKIKEMFLAVELEKKYSKNDILEFYLNNIYFANGYYGIQSASFGYFNKSVQELTLSEQAFLCAIPNNPSLYNPYLNMDLTLARRNRIIEQMESDGKLSAQEAQEARLEEIVLCQKVQKKNNFVETYAYDCAVRALMQRAGFVFRYSFSTDAEEEKYLEQYNQLYSECQLSLYTGGFRIYTSIDPKKQKALQAAVDEALSVDNSQNEEGVYRLQGAAVTLDNDNGRVVAIVGGRSQELAGLTLNRAFQSYRQPGSAIKPLIVYTPSFERGLRPEDVVIDEKKEDGPNNVDWSYSGEISVLRAVAVSKNTVAWNLFEELTPAVGLSYLLEMDFSKIVANDYYPAASLGGLTNGVSPVEMTAAFAAFPHDGIWREPTCILKIMDSEGTILVSELNMKERRVYGEEAVRRMNRCLVEVMTAGTGRQGLLAGMPCAGKTGTTNGKKDKWFVGFTHYYTTGVWVGYDMPASLDGLPDRTEPVRIWKSFMEPLHEGKEPREFSVYEMPIQKETEEKEEESEEEPEEGEESEEKEEDAGEEDAEEDVEIEVEEEVWEEEEVPEDEPIEIEEENEPEEDLPEDREEEPDIEVPEEDMTEEEPEDGPPNIDVENLSPEDYYFFFGEEDEREE